MPVFQRKPQKTIPEGGGLKQVPGQFPGVWELQGKHQDKCQRVKADGCKTQGQ